MTDEQTVVDRIAVFPRRGEFEKAHALLTRLQLPFEVVSPDPGYSQVGAPALICDSGGLSAILTTPGVTCAGWTEYHPPATERPEPTPQHFTEDVFGEAVIMFFGPCMAERNARPADRSPDWRSRRSASLFEQPYATGVFQRRSLHTHIHGRPADGYPVPSAHRYRQSG